MGEGKRNREKRDAAFARTYRAAIEPSLLEPIQNEAEIYGEIAALPLVVVTREPSRRLATFGFVSHACHDNAAAAVENSSGTLTAVAGWVVSGPYDDFATHSVVTDGQQWRCVTPFDNERTDFDFRPDPLLKIDIGSQTRKGIPVHVAVRAHPERSIAFAKAAIARCDLGGTEAQLVADIDALADHVPPTSGTAA